MLSLTKASSTSFLVVGWKLIAFAMLLLLTKSHGFQYNKDTLVDCSDRTERDCQTSNTIWFQCPVSCSEKFHVEGSMAEIHQDPEIFFQMEVTPAADSDLSLEDFEGYVTIYAVIPTHFPGMAKFYYDMLEHIASVYPFTVQFLVLPWQSQDDTTNDMNDLFALQRYQKRHAVILEPVFQPTTVLNYLLEAKIVAGNDNAYLKEDRVTIFLVSSDGIYVERLLSPTITLLERRIGVYLQQLSMSREL